MKKMRSTKELPISEAIAMLRSLSEDRQKERDDAVRVALAKVDKGMSERANRILLRVPEDFRAHVAEKAGIELPAANDAPSSANAEPRPDWLDEPAPAATRPIVVDRSERKVPRQ